MQTADMLEARSVSQPIPRSVAQVYEFIAEPANLSRWAAGLGSSFTLVEGVWTADTPQGRITMRFVERNPYGVADHYVRLPSGAEIYMPIRVIANGPGAEVQITVFRQPGMPDADFDNDLAAVARDLAALQALLTRDAPP